MSSPIKKIMTNHELSTDTHSSDITTHVRSHLHRRAYPYMDIYTSTPINTYTYIYSYMEIYMYLHPYIHTHIYTHTCTYTIRPNVAKIHSVTGSGLGVTVIVVGIGIGDPSWKPGRSCLHFISFLGKARIRMFFLHLWLNRRADWVF